MSAGGRRRPALAPARRAWASCSARAWARSPTPSQDAVAVGYDELPGFPRPTVHGHAGRAVLGHLSGVPVCVLMGRAHLYEGGDPGAARHARCARSPPPAPRSSC